MRLFSPRIFVTVASLVTISSQGFGQSVDSFAPTGVTSSPTLALQPDGKVLLTGSGIKRYFPDGRFDPTFAPPALPSIGRISVLLNGKIAAAASPGIVILNPDGSLDRQISVKGTVNGLLLQPGGTLLVGGSFSALADHPCKHLGRLYQDGTFDSSFRADIQAEITAFAQATDGRIFTAQSPFPYFPTPSSITCLHPDGSTDTNYSAVANGTIWTLVANPDGSLVVGGKFTTLGGLPCTNLMRLTSSGMSDTTFHGYAGGMVQSIVALNDGSLTAGGTFPSLCGEARTGLGAIHADGTLRSLFNPVLTPSLSIGSVNALAQQTDGKLLLSGQFNRVQGISRVNVARLNFLALDEASLTVAGNTLTWRPTGFMPRFSAVTFEFSANGQDWTSLGVAQNASNVWTLAGASLPPGATVRARGFVAAGLYNGSSWFLESVAGPPAISVQPLDRAVDAGTTAGLAIQAIGTAPLGFRWFKNGTPLSDAGKISGTTTASLILSNFLAADEGSYAVVVTNNLGSITSHIAVLSRGADPSIRSQPSNRTNNAASTATFTVSASGTPPIAYQWLRDGIALTNGANATGTMAPTLTLTNVLAAETGSYSVIVSNGSGTLTSRPAALMVVDPVFTNQPSSLTIVPAQGAVFSCSAAGTAPISYQWRKNGVAISSATTTTLNIGSATAGDAGMYDIVATSTTGVTTSSLAELSVNLAAVDSSNPAADNIVNALAATPDGTFYLGGSFHTVQDQSPGALARFTPQGKVMPPYLSAESSTVTAIALQPDGKLLIGGTLNAIGGSPSKNLGRLNRDGTLDPTFNVSVDAQVTCFAFQPDGKIIFGGEFLNVNGQGRSHIARITADGDLDPDFHPNVDSFVYSLALQSDGKILLGGWFDTIDGHFSEGVARLNPNGSVDESFTADVYPWVWCLALQPDGKIIVGGWIITVSDLPRSEIARLNSDGSPDVDFTSAANSDVYSVALQADGKIIVGGNFTTLNGHTRNRIGRLSADGSLDPTFNPGSDGVVYGVGLQTDGSILAGGSFSNLGGVSRGNAGRLTNTVAAAETLTRDGASVSWTRNGSAPEVEQASLYYSTNGIDWAKAGTPQRVSGGWQFTGLDLPANACLKASGIVRGGKYNGSCWVTEVGAGPLSIALQPSAANIVAGQAAAFTVIAYGNGPLAYQWFKDGVLLTDSPSCSGSQSPQLSLSNSLAASAGLYTVVIYDTSNSITSAPGGLNVIDPIIVQPPASTNVIASATATLNVNAVGTGPLHYQWLKNGTNIPVSPSTPDPMAAALQILNVSGADSGDYSVILSNTFGTATSAVAHLIVVDPAIIAHPASATLLPGASVTLKATVLATAPVSYQWRKNGNPLSGATSTTFTITNVQSADTGNYDLTISNAFGFVVTSNASVGLNQVTTDGEFRPNLLGPAGLTIYALAPLGDGGMLIGGRFQTVAGQSHANLARLLPNGQVDGSFNPGSSGSVNAICIQPDGKIVVGGSFTNLCGQPRTNIGRLFPDGTLDSRFTASAGTATATVRGVKCRADGKILVCGSFTSMSGAYRNAIGRLNPDGSIDTSFDSGVGGWQRNIYSMALLPDGRIVYGGTWTSPTIACAGRLTADGVTESGTYMGSSGAYVYSVLPLPDGSTLVGGNLGSSGDNLIQISSYGQVSKSYNVGQSSIISSMVMLADGGILLAGSGISIGGRPATTLAHVSSSVAFDPQFAPAPNGEVTAIALEAGGKILVGGAFTTIAGTTSKYLARLNNNITANRELSFDGSGVVWTCGGASPAFSHTTFDFSTNGTDWVSGSPGQSISGGWAMQGVALPAASTIRARGYTTSGHYGGSASIVEDYLGAAAISRQPESRTNDADTLCSFTVSAGGGDPLGFQWQRNGTNLWDGGNICGSHGPTLSVSNAFGADQADYTVIFSNSYRSVTSAVARLKVNDPAIKSSPVNQTAIVGGSVAFEVLASGTPSLALQWQRNGADIPGATRSSLPIASVQTGDAGSYTVVVSNSLGTTTSAVATLAIQSADSFAAAPNGTVYTLATQVGGKILIGGNFTMISDEAAPFLVRLNADGSTDSSFFRNAAFNRLINCLGVQPNGQIIVGGGSSTYIARLNTDGTIDTAFGAQANYIVLCVAIQPDSKIVVGGGFAQLNGVSQPYLGRLNPDGTRDTNFLGTANGVVRSLALQPDGKILVGGTFILLDGQTRNRLGRLKADGSLDTAFNPGADGDVFQMVVLPNTDILVAGSFSTIGGQPRKRIARLNQNGVVDSSFNPGAGATIQSLSVQTDGKIIVGGTFTSLADQPVTGLGRLLPNGVLDTNFVASVGGSVNCTAITPEGKLLVGGNFTSLGGLARTNLGRLNGLPAWESIAFDGTQLRWERGGSSPEVWRASFEESTDGMSWRLLGDATNATDAWSLPATGLSVHSTIRARGFVQSGNSSWFVESTTDVAPDLRPAIASANPTPAFQDGYFTFGVNALSGQKIVIEASSDFIVWTSLQTNVVGGLAQVIFSDAHAGEFPHRFYRASVYEGALPPLTIGPAPLLVGGTHLRLKLQGTPGQRAFLQTSTNLVDWTLLESNVMSSDSLCFDEPLGLGPIRFYRAWSDQ